MSARTNRWVIAAAIAALILGAILVRVIEAGVRVEKIMLTGNTPALRLFPATPGPHPKVLLAHGNGGSKENLFSFGEALAAAGFDCYSVDQAGYGESPQPWSLTPVLARAAVVAACATVGKPVPAAPTAWRWRFAGPVLGIAGALGLMFRLPDLHPRLARTRRYIVPAVLLIALGLTLSTWVGVTPQLRRIPQQLVLLPVIWLALAGLNKLRMPRWSLAVVTGVLALGCLALRIAYAGNIIVWLFATLMCTLVISTLLLLPAVAVGRIATRRGSRRDGDVAMAIFASYVIGQFMPLFY